MIIEIMKEKEEMHMKMRKISKPRTSHTILEF